MFSFKSPGGHVIYRRNARGAWNTRFHLGQLITGTGVDVRNQVFLLMVLRCARFATNRHLLTRTKLWSSFCVNWTQIIIWSTKRWPKSFLAKKERNCENMQTLFKLAFKRSRKLVSLDAKRKFVFENPSKKMPKSLVHFNHDTLPLKTRFGNPASSTNWASRGYYTIACHRLKQWSLMESTRGEPGFKTKLSMRSLSRPMTSDGVVAPWGLDPVYMEWGTPV